MKLQSALIAVGVLLSTFATNSRAQTAGGQATEPALEEVVVTAERRAENLLKTGITASALSAEDLAKEGVTQVDQLQLTTPALSINDTGLAKFVNIRGLGKSVDVPNLPAGIAYYMDGVLVPNQIFLDNPYFDLQRVEILRGPQGTLVGMNSTGGAILVVSQTPKQGVTEASIEQTVGNHSNLETKAMINLPLGSSWAVRLAGDYEKRNSFFTNISANPSNHTPGDVNNFAARLTLAGALWAGADLALRYEVEHSDTGGPAGKPIPGGIASATFAQLAPANPYTVNYDVQPFRDSDMQRLSAELTWDLTNTVRLRSVSGYQYGTIAYQIDQDASPANTGYLRIPIREPVFSQEVNLLSINTDRLDWVAGLFYLHQDTNGEPHIVNVLAPIPNPPTLVIDVTGRGRNRNDGAFGQVGYKLSDVLKITTGLRYSEERHYVRGQVALTPPGAPPGAVVIPDPTTTNKSSAVTGKVALDYTISPDHLAYVFASRGYKGGGINENNTSYQSEFVWDYEAGLKSSWLGDELRTQLGVFRSNYSSMQLAVYDPILGGSTVSNVSRATVTGAELQMQAQLGGLGIQAQAAYTHSAIGAASLIDARSLPGGGNVGLGVPCVGAGVPAGCFDYSGVLTSLDGNPLPYAPQLTYSIGVDYRFGFGRDISLTPRVQLMHVGEQWANALEHAPDDYIGSRTLVNASLALRAGKLWHAELYGTNLANELYVAGKTTNIQYWGAPRQFGVRVGADF